MKNTLTLVLIIFNISYIFSQTLATGGLSTGVIFTPNSIAAEIDTLNNRLVGTTSVKVSTVENSLSIEKTISKSLKNSNKVVSIGIDLGGSGNGALSSIFKKGSFVNGAKGSLEIGIKEMKIKNEKGLIKNFHQLIKSTNVETVLDSLKETGYPYGHYFYVRPSFSGTNFTHLKNRLQSTMVFDTINQTQWSLTLGYNFWTSKNNYCNSIFGLSVSKEFSNNFNDLNLTSIAQTITTKVQNTDVSFTDQQNVYEGAFTSSKKNIINLEGYFTPYKNQEINFYIGHRTKIEKGQQSITEFSTGIIFEDAKKPDNPAIGLICTFKDLYNQNNNVEGIIINLTTRVGLSNLF